VVGSWLDRVARHAAGSSTPAPGSQLGDPATPTGTSRRDFLRRAGIVGAAVWTVPVIESAVAPAAAASTPTCTGVCGGTCPTCGVGQGPCTTNTQCNTGLVCSAGVCKTPQGGTCTTNANCSTSVCISGTCQGTVAGTTCSSGSTCLSTFCVGGKCHTGPNGYMCLTNADCYTNGGCNTTTHTCNKSSKGGACFINSDCSAGTCQGVNWGTITPGTCK
jgi:hypothetical protein